MLVAGAVLVLACAEKQPQPILIPVHLVVRNHTSDNVMVRVRIAGAVVFHAPTPAAPPEGPLVVAQELRAPRAITIIDAEVGTRTLEHAIDLPYAEELWVTADVYRDRVRLSVHDMSVDRDSLAPEASVRIPPTLQN